MNILYIVFFGYWILAAIMDWRSYYIPPWYLALSLFLFFLPVRLDPLSLLYGAAALLLYLFRPDSIGYADILYLIELAFFFDAFEMNVILLTAVGAGFFMLCFFRKKQVPFVTCLAAGLVVSVIMESVRYGIIGS